MRRLLTLLSIALTFVLSSCGGKFQLPTEHPSAREIPSDGSYTMEGTWTEMDSVRDVVLQTENGAKVYVLFNSAATTGPSVARGQVRCYQVATQKRDLTGSGQFQSLRGLFNPVAISIGANRLWVLDAGDSCMAKIDHQRGDSCDADPRPITPTIRPRPNIVRDYTATWRVRPFALVGGDTLSELGTTSFTDTTLVQVYGIAADADGRVYVAGLAAIYEPNSADPLHPERKFVSRIFRYISGPRYAGVVPADKNMPGSNWHRDTTWSISNGSGLGSVANPRGMSIATAGIPRLFVADAGNDNQGLGKTISIFESGVGFRMFDGGEETGIRFLAPSDGSTDPAGFLYLVDRGNRRVLRYTNDALYVQQVDVQANSFQQHLLDPVAAGANDTLVYVADRGRSQVIRYKRTPQ